MVAVRDWNHSKTLPAFCRVTGLVKRPGDTDVKIELWMPVQNWNGEFRPAASGFAGGTIGYGGMAELLRAGWATATTNRGHDGGGPWKVADMSSLPYHLMVSKAKADYRRVLRQEDRSSP